MDGSWFDQLARTFVTRTDRRRVLQGVSSLVAALLGTMTLEPTAAARRKPRKHGARADQGKGPRPGRCGQAGHPCKWNKQCCEFADLVCINGSCGCTNGQSVCEGRCIRLKTCADYPGQCGAALASGCPGTTIDCSNACGTGFACLANGSCAQRCSGPGICPTGCDCQIADPTSAYCMNTFVTCTGLQECPTGDAECPVGEACGFCPTAKCLPLCDAV